MEEEQFFEDNNNQQQHEEEQNFNNNENSQGPSFNNNMFLIFSSGIIIVIILIWIYYNYIRRHSKTQTFPCQCSKCEEKRKRNEIKKQKRLSSTTFQKVIIIILTMILIFNVIKIKTNSNEIPVAGETFDPYKILGVTVFSTEKEIRAQHRKLMLQYHPDKNKDEGAEEMFILIDKAYEILSNPVKKMEWEQTGRQDEERLEKSGIGLPEFLTNKGNKKIILMFYLILLIAVFPGVILFLLKKFNKIEGNNLNVETNGIFHQLIQTNLNFPTIIEVLSLSNEIRTKIKLHPLDQQYLPVLQKRIKEEFYKKPTYNIPEAIKGQILIGIHLSRLHSELPEYLRNDLDEILELIPNVLHGMVPVMFGKKNISAVFQCIKLNQMITQACGIDEEFLQLPDFNNSKPQSIFGKTMTFDKLLKLSTQERNKLINEKITDVEKEKQHKEIQIKKTKSEIKKQGTEKQIQNLKKHLNAMNKKEGKPIKFKDVETKKEKEIEEKKEVEHEQIGGEEKEIENKEEETKNQLIESRRKMMINFFKYHPSNIKFIIRAMGINGTRTVVAGIPISITINAYRFPRDENGELLPHSKEQLDKILNEEKQELPKESTKAMDLLRKPKMKTDNENDDEEDDDDIFDMIQNIEVVHEPPKDVLVHNPYCPNSRIERWWFIVTDVRDQHIFNAISCYIPISELPFITKIFIQPIDKASECCVHLHAICDSYLHCEYIYPVKFTVIERPTEEEIHELEHEKSSSEDDEIEDNDDHKKED